MANHEIRAATLLDLDVLNCPVCSEPLTIPTFQCDDGHLVCSICSTKLINKCPGPGCDLSIGNKQCFPMEKVIEAAIVPCRNAEFGCRQSFSYAKVSNHEKECNFFQCPCPDLECNYTGSYNNMYRHFVSNHVYNRNKSPTILMRNTALPVGMNINEKFLVLWDPRERLFIVVQCFRERQGFYISLRSIIAPSAAELVKIPYSLSYSTVDGTTIVYESPEVKRYRGLISQVPEDSFMVPNECLVRGEILIFELKVTNQDGLVWG